MLDFLSKYRVMECSKKCIYARDISAKKMSNTQQQALKF